MDRIVLLITSLFLLSPVVVAQIAIKGHVVGETFAEYVLKEGLDLGFCQHLAQLPPKDTRDLKNTQDQREACRGLLVARNGGFAEVKQGDDWTAVFDGGKLAAISIMTVRDFAGAVEELTRKYGAVTEQTIIVVQNDYGCGFDTRHAKWFLADGAAIVADEHLDYLTSFVGYERSVEIVFVSRDAVQQYGSGAREPTWRS